MPATIERPSRTRPPSSPDATGVLVACPDARPPAYQAAVGLARSGRLQEFVTGYYHKPGSALACVARRIAPSASRRLEARLLRRHEEEIPERLVSARPLYDAALAVENRSGAAMRASVAAWRTRRFDRSLANRLVRRRPDCLFAFSDVASGLSLPLCRREGIATVLSMVHGDVREEREVLERERERSPEFFRIYLGDGPIDEDALRWLHDRRLRDVAWADLILVPSEHIAERLARHGTDRDRIAVVPYAADCGRFAPAPDKVHGPGCRFLFAGGISQRKGIKDLLDAWRLVRRPGWTLSLLGGLPRDESPLLSYRDEVEWLGRVGHAEMPAALRSADVFVFPSLFEGSAVVTYEALACGLPSIATAESGTVARHGVEGLIVPAADPVALAGSMERLGGDPALRAEMARAARARAEGHDWPRYHASILEATGAAIATRGGHRC